MSKIYQYGYKLIPLYFVVLGLLCVGLYWFSYPLFEYETLSNYMAEVPQPLTFYSNEAYSWFNLITGFFLIFIVGIHFALIIGGSLSIYWSEFTHSKIRKKGFNLIEIFVNIPLVAYGYLLLMFVSELMDLEGSVLRNLLIISFILGGMMLPKLIYKFISILQSIPYNQREGAYSLGASRYRTAVMVLIPSQMKLFIAAIINIVARAFSEILIVLLLAGFITEIVEVIITIISIAIISTTLSQWLKKSHKKDETV